METLFDNIGGLFIIAVILIVRAVFRKAGAAEEASEDSAQGLPEADLQTEEMHGGMRSGIPSAETARARMAMQKHADARKSELQAKRKSRQQAANAAASSSRMAAKSQPHPVPQPAPAASQPASDRNEWMEGFDIRRAVVWSEILRPKFEEDEV